MISVEEETAGRKRSKGCVGSRILSAKCKISTNWMMSWFNTHTRHDGCCRRTTSSWLLKAQE